MATFVVGDIHGYKAALDEVLAAIAREVHEDDVVVFVGDYIDRGEDSKGCIDAILTFRDESPADVVCLRGNHEDWFLRTARDYSRHSWLMGMEGLSTVRSYSADADAALRAGMAEAGLQLFVGHVQLPYEAFFSALPQSHKTFFSSLALYLQTADCICTHAGLDPAIVQLEDQSRDCLIWGHEDFPEAYSGSLPVVYGHHNNAAISDLGWPQPQVIGNTIGIDTIAHGVLTAIRLPDRKVFQSRRYQRRRT